jgi:hypothetical protein
MANQDSRQQEIRIQQLFSTMQAAERNKDIDPIAYKRARIAYYRAAQGEGWIATEESSLRNEAAQTTAMWKSKYISLQGLRDTHQTNLDIVRGAETRQSSLGEDFKYAVGELKRLVARDEDASVLTEREAYLRAVQYGPPSWSMYVLDALIVLLLVYGIYILYSKFGVRWAATGALIAQQDALLAQRSYMNYLRQQLS